MTNHPNRSRAIMGEIDLLKVETARSLIKARQEQEGRRLSHGERRHLLAQATAWEAAEIRDVANWIATAEGD